MVSKTCGEAGASRLNRGAHRRVTHQLELLDRPLDLLRRSTELRPPEPGNLQLELLDLQRLGHQPRLGCRKLRLARRKRISLGRHVSSLAGDDSMRNPTHCGQDSDASRTAFR